MRAVEPARGGGAHGLGIKLPFARASFTYQLLAGPRHGYGSVDVKMTMKMKMKMKIKMNVNIEH